MADLKLRFNFIHTCILLCLSAVCSFKGIKYTEGTQIQPSCSTRCFCQNGEFHCITQSCLLSGEFCYASGDPHYSTFDHRNYDFQGVCEYVLTQPCDSNNFSIIVNNTAINQFVSRTSSVRILVPHERLDILLGRVGSITVNEQPQFINSDRIILQYSDTVITRVGGHPHVFLTRSRIEIFFDGRSRVAVKASLVWKGKLCGLCGNYNDDPSDDFKTPNGALVNSPNDFGFEWLTSKSHEDCSLIEPPPDCLATTMTEATLKCNILKQGAFKVCNSAVDPKAFINECAYDWCYCNEEDKENCFCDSLSYYVAACANNNITIPQWRNSFCSKLRL